MPDGGEIIPESRGMNGGRAAQASPYHNMGANGSRFADRNLAVMYGTAEVLKMATATNAELLARAGKAR